MAPLGGGRGGEAARPMELPVVDYMEEMRKKIEQLQELAANSRPCAAFILELLFDRIFPVSEGEVEGVVPAPLDSSPEYRAPDSPEYIPPSDSQELEVSERGGEVEVSEVARFSCGICAAEFDCPGPGPFEVTFHNVWSWLYTTGCSAKVAPPP